MKADDINRIFNISESFQLPRRILDVLFSDYKNRILDELMSLGEDLDHDWFTEYFEENHANKSKMAQDFTPRAVSDLLAGLLPEAKTVGDVCAGTGGLTIGYWNRNRDASFICYEISERAISLLLLNLTIRNIEGAVFRMDILTGEVFESYRLQKGSKYSELFRDPLEPPKVDIVISNPPYSLKYVGGEDESRFGEFAGMIPSNFADHAFIAFALTMSAGRCGFILPHGVLFRANKEGAIREKLVKDQRIETIIGLPGRLFLNTDIPTCVMILGRSSDLLFIDASSECRKDRKLNVMDPDHVKKILETAERRSNVKNFAHRADLQEIETNGFNLNIPRYVNTYTPPEPIDLNAVAADLLDIDMKLDQTSKDLAKMMGELVTDDPKDSEGIRKYINYLTKRRRKENGPEQISFDFGLPD